MIFAVRVLVAVNVGGAGLDAVVDGVIDAVGKLVVVAVIVGVSLGPGLQAELIRQIIMGSIMIRGDFIIPPPVRIKWNGNGIGFPAGSGCL
jgi:hypothetical protein